MLIPKLSCTDVTIEQFRDLVDLVGARNRVARRKFQVDRTRQVALYEGGIESDSLGLVETLSSSEDKKEANTTPINDRRIGAFSSIKDLKVATNNEARLELVNKAIGATFAPEGPSGFHNLFAVWVTSERRSARKVPPSVRDP